MEIRNKEELKLLIEIQLRTIIDYGIVLRDYTGEQFAHEILKLLTRSQIQSLMKMRCADTIRTFSHPGDDEKFRAYSISFQKYYNEHITNVIENVGLPITLSLGKDELSLRHCADKLAEDLYAILTNDNSRCFHTNTQMGEDSEMVCPDCGESINW